MKGIATWMVAALFAMVVGLVSWPGRAQMERRPGSFFIGDTDGDGIVAPRDVFGLQFKIIRPSTEFPEVVPSNGDNLDLDGDGAIGPGDFIVIQNWILGNFASFPGRPQHVIPELKSYVITGISDQDSVEIYAQVFAGSTAPLSGWGVIFTVDANAPYCSAVRLLGRRVDPQPEHGRDQYAIGPEVFEYTGAASTGGKAKVKLLVDNCPRLSQINILVRLPSDDESHNPPGRLPDTLDGDTSINREVHVGGVWMELCGGGICSSTDNGVIAGTGMPFIAGSSDGLLHVTAGTGYRTWDGSAWSSLINIPFTVADMAIDPTTNRPVIAAVVNNEIYITRWTGIAWQGLGGSDTGGGVSNTAGQVSIEPSLSIGPDGMPGVVWKETVGGDTTQVFYRKWNGSTWAEFSGSGSGNGISNSLWGIKTPSLTIDNDNLPIIAWSQLISTLSYDTYYPVGYFYLKKWNGANWIELGGSASGTGVNDCRCAPEYHYSCVQTKVFLNSNNQPAVSWFQGDGSGSLSRRIYIKEWTGYSWQFPPSLNSYPVGRQNNYDIISYLLDSFIIAEDDREQPMYIGLVKASGNTWTGMEGNPVDIFQNSCFYHNNLNPSLTLWRGRPAIAWNIQEYQIDCGRDLAGTYLKAFIIP